MNQHYEWKPVQNISNLKNGDVVRYRYEGQKWESDVLDSFNRKHLYVKKEIEYLAEVAPIEWPGDEQINLAAMKYHNKKYTPFNGDAPRIMQTFVDAINWLKQVTIKI